MNKTILYIYSIVATLGLADSLYLTYTRLLDITPPCGISILSGCATVAKSQYSVLFGIPLSVFGILFYGALLLIAVSLIWKTYRYSTLLLVAFSILGAISSLYFVYLQAFVIRAFCIYCVFSALCSFLLCALSIFIYRRLSGAKNK